MAASALSVELSLTVSGGDANPAMRGDDEEGQGQRQQDGEDVGEVSLSQSTLPRRGASRSRSPPQRGCADPASAFETLTSAFAMLKKCVKATVAAGDLSHRTPLIESQMRGLQERDHKITMLLDIYRRCPAHIGCPARRQLDILLNTQEREVTALQKELTQLQLWAIAAKHHNDDRSGSSSD